MASSKREVTQDALPAFIELPTSQLLAKFGEGGHKPGSGSAAALSGFYAAALMQTVAQRTLTKEKYAPIFPEVELVRERSRATQAQLTKLFQEDAEKFDRVMQLRFRRDAETDIARKRVLRDQARNALVDATDIPLEIARLCISLADNALWLFDYGYQAVRGDSGVAASMAIAGATGAVFVVYLNLTGFREGEWAVRTREACDRLHATCSDLQRSQFDKVNALQAEGLPEDTLIQPQLPLTEEEDPE